MKYGDMSAHIIQIGQGENQNGAVTRAIRWHYQGLCVYGASPFCSQWEKLVYNEL